MDELRDLRCPNKHLHGRVIGAYIERVCPQCTDENDGVQVKHIFYFDPETDRWAMVAPGTAPWDSILADGGRIALAGGR